MKEGARTGLQIVSDVASGQRVGSSLKRRSAEAGKRLLHNAASGSKRIKTTRKSGRKQTGGGQRKRKKSTKRNTAFDIFG